MREIKDVMGKIEEWKNNINQYYCAPMSALLEIQAKSEDVYESISNGFVLGYMQGYKAAEAKRRKVACK